MDPTITGRQRIIIPTSQQDSESLSSSSGEIIPFFNKSIPQTKQQPVIPPSESSSSEEFIPFVK